VKKNSHHKGEVINPYFSYITLHKSYIIHVLSFKGRTEQSTFARASVVKGHKVVTGRGGVNYFLGDISTTTPPTPITAIPIRGDQLR
jgi:hypothetical protein